MPRGDNIRIEALEIEFVDGGNTLWVHGPQGGTVLRIKTMGKIIVSRNCGSPIPHADIMTNDPIVVCMP